MKCFTCYRLCCRDISKKHPCASAFTWEMVMDSTNTSSTAPSPIIRPVSQHCYISDLMMNTCTQSVIAKEAHFLPCVTPAQWRVHNAGAMHGWTNARMMKMFFPESTTRNCPDILAFFLCHMLARYIPNY